MADRRDGACGQAGHSRQPRNRRRLAAAGVTGAAWVFLLAYTGSLVAGTALLLLLAVFVTLCTVALRGLGMTGDQDSGAQRTAARQWREGRDALALGLRRLADVSAGRAGPAPGYAGPAPGHTDQLTMAERPVIPPLRLVTGDSVAETRSSGARAGRGGLAELCLPDVPTVSRVHAKFTFTGGQWWITSLGRNGVTLNGTFLADERALMAGDSIRWGSRPDAPASRVEIG